MSDIFDYGDDQLDESSTHSDSGIAELSRLVTLLAQQDIEVERAEAHLKKMKEDRDDLRRRRIPDLMDELNCRTHETKAGLKVTVKNVVKASITDKTRNAAIAWFDEQNLGRMVKNEFTLKLSKGEEDRATQLRHAIEGLGLEYKNKKNVHHSTLSAFIKERDAAGESTPDELFNVYRYSEAKIG
jgi:uncharacterized small protein (DUF1192 family)